MIAEDLDHRVWAALRPVDAWTAQPVDVQPDGEGQRWLRNRSGLWVLNGLAPPTPRQAEWQAYEDRFDAPTALSPWVLQVILQPASRAYLARRLTLSVPRSDQGAQAPLFTAQAVAVYPGPAGSVAPGWALLRLSLTRQGQPAAGAVFSVHSGDASTPRFGQGQTDSRGEGVLAVTDQPHFLPSAGPQPFTRTRTLQVHGVYEPAAVVPPDPDDLATRSGAGFVAFSAVVTLASGRGTVLALDLP